MYATQQGRGAPFVQAPPQRHAADPIPRGSQFPPLHAFAQKEPQRFDHRRGGAARTTMIAAWPFNPVDQASHQAACRRSHRALSRVNAQESWAHSASPAAVVRAKNTYLPPSRLLKTVLKSPALLSSRNAPLLDRSQITTRGMPFSRMTRGAASIICCRRGISTEGCRQDSLLARVAGHDCEQC